MCLNRAKTECTSEQSKNRAVQILDAATVLAETGAKREAKRELVWLK